MIKTADLEGWTMQTMSNRKLNLASDFHNKGNIRFNGNSI